MNNQFKSKKISTPLGILLILLAALLVIVLLWQCLDECHRCRLTHFWMIGSCDRVCLPMPPSVSKKEVEFAECSSHYTVSCYDEDYSEVIKENIPCFDENNCSLEDMNSYCSPGRPNVLKCIGAKYYCGDEGFCKGCDCPI